MSIRTEPLKPLARRERLVGTWLTRNNARTASSRVRCYVLYCIPIQALVPGSATLPAPRQSKRRCLLVQDYDAVFFGLEGWPFFPLVGSRLLYSILHVPSSLPRFPILVLPFLPQPGAVSSFSSLLWPSEALMHDSSAGLVSFVVLRLR